MAFVGSTQSNCMSNGRIWEPVMNCSSGRVMNDLDFFFVVTEYSLWLAKFFIYKGVRGEVRN